MKDREKFMENCTLQRQKGRLKYILIQAGRVAVFGLAGVIVGSVFFYNSPSAYSFSYYLPIYILVFLGMFIVAIPILHINGVRMKKDATSIGIIGIPDDATITRLEKELGKPILKIEKDGKIILLVGRGLFKKKIVIPVEK